MGSRRGAIGVTCCIDTIQRPIGRADERLRLNMSYLDAILAAGGLAVPLTPVQDPGRITQQVASIDGLLITGGPDVPPDRYGSKVHPKTIALCERRADYEFSLFAEADKKGLPILGICLGHQIINVGRGGTLIQHLDDVVRTPPISHSDGLDYIRHTVATESDSLLRRIVEKETVEANSSHHQAVERIGTGLFATACAPDGVIEAIEDPSRRFLLGVQWHPEVIAHLQDHGALFRALVEAADPR
jgi:putative glutamine amidotransferase